MKRVIVAVAAVVVLAAQAATAGAGGSGLPTSIGKGEGKLNLIAWEGYTEPQWVKPFEKQTGCQVNAKYAGSSDEMVALMSQGGDSQYDLVSASGDAECLHGICANNVESFEFARGSGFHHGASRQARR